MGQPAVFGRIRHDVGLETARLHDLRQFVATQLIGAGFDVPHRGRLRPEIWDAWRAAH